MLSEHKVRQDEKGKGVERSEDFVKGRSRSSVSQLCPELRYLQEQPIL